MSTNMTQMKTLFTLQHQSLCAPFTPALQEEKNDAHGYTQQEKKTRKEEDKKIERKRIRR